MSVTPQQVKTDFPFDTDYLDTLGLSDNLIQDYIDDGHAEMAAVVRLGGRAVADLKDEPQRQFEAAVRGYATYKSMKKIGRTASDAYTEAKSMYQDNRDRLQNNPDLWADSAGVQAVSNVDQDEDDRPSEFSAPGYDL